MHRGVRKRRGLAPPDAPATSLVSGGPRGGPRARGPWRPWDRLPSSASRAWVWAGKEDGVGRDAGPAWPGDGAAETAARGLGTGSLRFACFYLTSTGAGSPWRLP